MVFEPEICSKRNDGQSLLGLHVVARIVCNAPCFPVQNLYFDHNATTPVAPEVQETMAAALKEAFGNPSSVHRAGQIAREKVEWARRLAARFIGSSPAEIIFTSGGTEANNLAILGLVRNMGGASKHVITTAIEHPSVSEPIRQLEREGVSVTVLPVNKTGAVDPAHLARELRPDTVLVSAMHANNETGVIQPIEEIAGVIRTHRSHGNQVYFHSDGIQSFGKLQLNLSNSGIDCYSASAHKIFGPKGVGFLYVRKGTPIKALQFGGRHERERRAGTENVPAIAGFGRAIDISSPATSEARDYFEASVLAALPDTEVNGIYRLPNTSNLYFPGVSGESLTIALDMKGMAVSTGSACSSGSIEPSPVLLAMGRSKTEARSCVRFSFGRYQTIADAEMLSHATIACVHQLQLAHV